MPGRLTEAGFTFEHPDWPAAAADLVRTKSLPSATSRTTAAEL
ncbi:DUF1731 domain-containing protein [Kribbella sp. NBC_01505]